MQITNEVSTYTTEGIRYVPGDIVTIDSSDFCSSFMVKILDRAETTPTIEATDTVVITEPEAETLAESESKPEAEVEVKPKPKSTPTPRRRRST